MRILPLLVLGCCLGSGCVRGVAMYQGPPSDHFDGTRFFTPGWGSQERIGLRQILRWRLARAPGAWSAVHDQPPGPRPPYEVGSGELRVTYINHATTLLQLDGVNVLTDPIYSRRCSPFDFLGPARVRVPGIRFEDLPRIDAVVLSHNHYDHLDAPTLRRLADRWPGIRFFVGLGNRELLEGLGLRHVTELDWWESRPLRGITVRSVPSQHGSGRLLYDADRTLWTAWVLEGSGGRAYFAGDTGYGPHFEETERRLGPMRLAVLPIGAFRPEWLLGPVHEAPVSAVRAARDLRAGLAVPIHYGTFELGDDGETEALELLKAAAVDGGVRFAALGFGEGLDVPCSEPQPLPGGGPGCRSTAAR